MKMALANVERVKNGNTAQGFWVFGADGSFYGYNNNRSVERVNQLLDQAQVKFRSAKPEGGAPTEAELAAPWVTPLPREAMVVRVWARIRPVPAGCADSNRRVSRDHLWITEEEQAQIIKAASSANANGKATTSAPESLLNRVARFHLVDNVRGEPDMWQKSEVKKLEGFLVSAGPVEVSAEFSGRFEMATADGKRGYRGTLRARLWYTSRGRPLRFQAYATGTAWGSGTYTPDAPKEPFTLVIGMDQAIDEAAKVVPPQGILWGGEYWGR